MGQNAKIQDLTPGWKARGRVFVAGGTGLVGGALLRALVAAGCTDIVTNYHQKRPAPEVSPVPPEAWHRLDLTSQAETEAFFAKQRPRYVFLAAAKVGGIVANDTYKADFIYENIAIAANVIHAAYRHGVVKLLNLGSSCIYPKEAPQPLRESYLLTGPLESTNEAYAVAKIAAIKLCRYYNEQYGTDFISVMPTNLYGPGDNFDLFTSHVLPALIRKFHLGRCLAEGDRAALRRDLDKRPIDGVTGDAAEERILATLARHGVSAPGIGGPVTVTLWGTGTVYREFLHVDDLAAACLWLMEKVDAKAMAALSPDCFVNVGVGRDLTIRDLAALIREIVGFRGEVVFDAAQPDGTPRKLLDVSHIEALGWRPRIPLADGIASTYAWYLGSGLEY